MTSSPSRWPPRPHRSTKDDATAEPATDQPDDDIRRRIAAVDAMLAEESEHGED